MTINEKEIFKPRFRKQHFRNGTIYLTDSEDIGKDLVYDNGNKICTLAKYCRPLFRVFSSDIIVYKALSDGRNDSVHVIVFNNEDDYAVYSGFTQGFDQVVYVTEHGEIYRWNIGDSSPRLWGSIPEKGCENVILYENGFMVPNDKRTMLPYDFYDYEGKINKEQRLNHLGGLLAFIVYLYLRITPDKYISETSNRYLCKGLLFGNEAITYERVWGIINYLKEFDNYNYEVGASLEKALKLMGDSFIPDFVLSEILDRTFSIEYNFSEEDKEWMFKTDRLGNYFERRYQAEKNLNVGDQFLSIYDTVKSLFSHNDN